MNDFGKVATFKETGRRWSHYFNMRIDRTMIEGYVI
jgi:hypothetical protein